MKLKNIIDEAFDQNTVKQYTDELTKMTKLTTDLGLQADTKILQQMMADVQAAAKSAQQPTPTQPTVPAQASADTEATIER